MTKTVEEMQEILWEADQILKRAKEIVSDAPYFTYVAQEEHASIIIDDGEATIYWPEASSGYYDSCSIETQSRSFPSELLLMDDEQFVAWKSKERAKYNEAQKARTIAAVVEREREERAAYERLKAKFGKK